MSLNEKEQISENPIEHSEIKADGLDNESGKDLPNINPSQAQINENNSETNLNMNEKSLLIDGEEADDSQRDVEESKKKNSKTKKAKKSDSNSASSPYKRKFTRSRSRSRSKSPVVSQQKDLQATDQSRLSPPRGTDEEMNPDRYCQ